MFSKDFDFMQLKTNPKVLKVLQTKGQNFPENEKLLLSSVVIKINRKEKEQHRLIIITNKAIYNLKRNKYTFRRRIPIQALGSITESTSSDEFVLHVPEEYDYRYKSDKKRAINDLIVKAFKKINSSNKFERKKLIVIQKPESNLGKYTMTKTTPHRESLLKQRMAMLEEVSKNDSDKEEQSKKRKTSQLIEGTDKVSAADFELLKVLGRGSFGKVMQVRRKKDQRIYAMKILKKATLIENDQVEHTKAE
eukprot:CAMPEP_0184502596 /NCGR_PEP_ID=MMETSP0113_2-20130426/50823_1 /TAXON_ID=91329 /ORGANISM="Norrisiella sphaerica, Strain BC52" /LENGTH=249 /DNA_ID=CAMNT_0026891855 /DNA_START=88 /DNA_END=834 /DNA_ORIENTATION=+